jgi:deoxyribodipyrimidine photo-lyase
VYTPYARAWWRRFEAEPPPKARALRLPPPLPLASLLIDAPDVPAAGAKAALRRLDAFLDGPVRDYAWRRDLPAEDGTSRLSASLRFGTISVRTCLRRALEAARDDRRKREGVARWTGELVWREFYAAVLAEHPRVLRGAYRPELARVRWRDDERGFEAWREGRTGYPFVDAGMRQLRATGWMHNRARMVAASFLCKHLLIDWRRGERWFMESLVDGDPASNNGGWQWSASTGTDAQPWFRVFNPIAQGERFDPERRYARRYVPELDTAAYPPPIVEHGFARERALAAYRKAAKAAR